MRLFFAIHLPSEIKQAVTRIQNELKKNFRHSKITWVDPRLMHITLLFIGDAATKEQAEKLSALEIKPGGTQINLTLKNVNAFPATAHPRTLVVECENADRTLLAIQKELITKTHSLGCSPDYKPFRSHITLGRVKEPIRIDSSNYEVEQLSWSPTSFELMSSALGSTGPTYSIIKTCILS